MFVSALLAASLPLLSFSSVSALVVDPRFDTVSSWERSQPPAGVDKGSGSNGAASLPQNMVIFGDSYTDNCNFWREFSVPPNVSDAYPFPSCPPPPTGRADNGMSWAEYIANTTRMNVFNFAYSGATCNNTLFSRAYKQANGTTAPDPDVTMQIDRLQANESLAHLFDSQTVAAIFIGTNDLNFFFSEFLSSPNATNVDRLPPGATILDEASCVVAQVNRLHELGIRKFLVLQNIPLQLTSMYSANTTSAGAPQTQNGPFIAETMANYVNTNNKLQMFQLGALQQSLKDGTTVDIFPTYDLFWDFYHNPSKYDFKNVTSYCDQPSGPCSNPEDYLFWNNLHPGEHADRILASKVVSFLQGQTDVTSGGSM